MEKSLNSSKWLTSYRTVISLERRKKCFKTRKKGQENYNKKITQNLKKKN